MAKKRFNLLHLLIGLLVASGVIFLLWPEHNVKSPTPKAGRFQLERTGAGLIVNYMAACNDIHTVVDRALANNSVRVDGQEGFNRQVPRQQMEGTIQWHTRNVMITLPTALTAEELQTRLSADLLTVQAQLLAVQSERVNNQPVIRLDIGFSELLENEQITIITDRLYIAQSPVSAAPDKEKAPPPISSGGTKGKLAIVIDDFGYQEAPIAQFASMPKPITFSILPNRTYSKLAAAEARKAGKQTMLHLPMEPLAKEAASENSTVLVSMNDAEIQQVVEQALQAVPGVQGVNNHQGSRATGDRRVMRAALTIIARHKLFFVDSHTHHTSVALATAREMGIPSGINQVFLDNEADVEYIKGQAREAIRIAVSSGHVIVIGHARPTTAIAIREMLPEFERQGIELVYASALAR